MYNTLTRTSKLRKQYQRRRRRVHAAHNAHTFPPPARRAVAARDSGIWIFQRDAVRARWRARGATRLAAGDHVDPSAYRPKPNQPVSNNFLSIYARFSCLLYD